MTTNGTGDTKKTGRATHISGPSFYTPALYRNNIFLDLQDYTYYFVPAPWLSCKLLRLLQLFPPPSEQARLVECLETILNKVQEAPKSKKIQHSNAKNAVLLEGPSSGKIKKQSQKSQKNRLSKKIKKYKNN